VRDIFHVGVVRGKETAHKAVVQRVLRNVAFPKRVRADRDPLHERIGHPYLATEEVCRSLVIPGRRDEAAENPHDRFFKHPATCVEAPGAIHRDAAHENELDRLCGPQRLDRSAQPRCSPRDEVSRRPEDALEVGNVAKARDDNIAAADLAQEVIIAERQEIGLDHRQVGVARDARRELPGGSHDHADADTAA